MSSPGDLPDPGIEPMSPVAPVLQAEYLPRSRHRSPHLIHIGGQLCLGLKANKKQV